MPFGSLACSIYTHQFVGLTPSPPPFSNFPPPLIPPRINAPPTFPTPATPTFPVGLRPPLFSNMMNSSSMTNSLSQGGNNFEEAFTQNLMNDPQMMRQVMSSPMMRSMMSNPEILRTLMEANPQMRELRERNPELNHLLNDPEV